MAQRNQCRQRQRVGRKGHRLGMEIAARDDFRLATGTILEDQRVIRDGIGFDQQGAARIALLSLPLIPVVAEAS